MLSEYMGRLDDDILVAVKKEINRKKNNQLTMNPLDRMMAQRGILEGSEPISQVLSKKADREDIQLLLMSKADRISVS